MNRSLLEVGGGLLAVSQFTLYGDARKGRRPSFVAALEPRAAQALYEDFLAAVAGAGVKEVAAGRFGAMMEVDFVNWGPLTILLDSRKEF
jgi:D-tyrosyl-tRNA(Tyr) deacylase